MHSPITAFVSYSHRDSGPQAELRIHLANLERQGHLRLWSDERILAGDDWSPRISDNLERSQLVLVLLSPDYLASKACQAELQRALELRATRGVRLVPAVLRTCDWTGTPLAAIQLAWGRSTDLPLADLPPGDRRDRAFQTIVDRVKPVLRDLGAALPDEGAFDLDLAPFDFETHRRYLADQHGRWAGAYTPLDAEPVVLQLGGAFAPTGKPPVPVTEVARRRPRLVLLGGAGTGKTTTLLYLAQALSRDGAGDGDPSAGVCVFVQLSRFRRIEAATPLEAVYDLVAEALHNSRATRERVLPGAIGRMLERRPAVLLLDGLNEVSRDRQTDCLRGISDLVRRHPAVRLVLTSRPHGITPQDLLEGWDFFALTRLSDQQIGDLVERRLGETVLAAELLRGLMGQRSLLRVPLFLRMILDLPPDGLARALRRLGDRSGLVKDYADYLLRWNTAPGSGVDVLSVRGALRQVARVLQSGGQHVREDELRHGIDPSVLEEALRRGILVRDEGYVRFFHQVLQEHFCAAALIDDWRRRRTAIKDLPRTLRRALADPAMLEVAGHVIAIADDAEAGVLLDHVAARHQALLLRWLDDLCAGSTSRVDIGPALTRLGRSFRRGLWFSRVPFIGRESTTRRDRLVKLVALLYVAAMAGFGVAGALQEPLQLGDAPAAGIGTVLAIVLAAVIGWTFVPSGRAEALVVAARETSSARLRQELMVLVARAAGSKLANPPLRELAASLLGATEQGSPAETLSTSVAPYAAVRLLAYDPSRQAFHMLVTLLGHDNCFGLAALRALDVRAGRFPQERAEILALARRLVDREAPDLRIYTQAHGMAVHGRSGWRWFWGESPLSFWRWAWRRYRRARGSWTPIAVGLGVLVALLALTVGLNRATGIDAETILGIGYLASCAVIAPLVYRDARRIGVGSLRGGEGLNELGPRLWTLLAAVYGPLVAPLYLWQRGWILRSVEPDWPAIEIQARDAAQRDADASHQPSPTHA